MQPKKGVCCSLFLWNDNPTTRRPDEPVDVAFPPLNFSCLTLYLQHLVGALFFLFLESFLSVARLFAPKSI